jgi:DNA-binding MarR family transcriptional regulator
MTPRTARDIPGPAQMRAWRAFLEAHATITRELDAELRAERDLPLTWYDVLLRLSEARTGRLRMRELADAALFSPSGLTRLLDRMEERGLVRREPCEDDRRGSYAVLTPAGTRAFKRAAPAHLRGVQRHFAGRLRGQDVAALEAALRQLRNADSGGGEPRAATRQRS